MKFIGGSYSLYAKDIHQIWCRSAKFLWTSKFYSESGSGWGSWYYFGFQYQTIISYIEDTHQILFASANSFKSYCVHMRSPLRHTNHEHLSKGENFFFTHAILILSLFTYSVCDEKVKKLQKGFTTLLVITFARRITVRRRSGGEKAERQTARDRPNLIFSHTFRRASTTHYSEQR